MDAVALEGVTFWYFRPGPGGTADRVFTHRIDAERAELTPGFWQLTGVVENRLGGDVRRVPNLALPTNLRSDTLLTRFASAETVPVLGAAILHRSGALSERMEVDAYVLKFHGLLTFRFSCWQWP